MHPEARDNSRVDLNERVVEQIAGTVDELRRAGATDSEIRIAFSDVMSRNSG